MQIYEHKKWIEMKSFVEEVKLHKKRVKISSGLATNINIRNEFLNHFGPDFNFFYVLIYKYISNAVKSFPIITDFKRYCSQQECLRVVQEFGYRLTCIKLRDHELINNQ